MKRIAVFISVSETTVSNFSNIAIQGVDVAANNLRKSLSKAFRAPRVLQYKVTKEEIIETLQEVSEEVDEDGVCLIYFHGHGTSVKNDGIDKEKNDQAFVCYDDLLMDDEIDKILSNFKTSVDLITIADCCSSETLVEWNQMSKDNYPNIFHIAAANDDEIAYSTVSGGLLSDYLNRKFYRYSYQRFTYGEFMDELQNLENDKLSIFVKTNKNKDHDFLSKKLFS